MISKPKYKARSLFVLTFLLFLGIALHAQQTYTFTACGATGRFGPTQAQVSAAYNNTNLSGNVTIVTQGIQEWIVPATGAYAIAAYGAQGCGTFGGRGAQMIGEFQLTAGQVLRILVGQQSLLPANASYNAQFGGGGGSFVTDNANTPMIVAGGGGGNWASGFSVISDAPLSTTGNTGGGVGSTGGAGGTGGTGGMNDNSAEGGGGFNSNGMSATAGGFAFLNGGMGGFSTYGEGGFGGGGGTASFNNRRGGGGGGYSGGGGAHGGTTGFPEAGGGGSYNNGTNQNNLVSANTGDGRVVITKLCNVSIAASTNPICLGQSITLSTNAITTTSWSAPGSPATNSITVSPSVTTSYTVTGVGSPSNCVGSAVLIVTVQPLPSVSAVNTPTTVCANKTATLTGFGANTYTWSNNQTGLNATVNPSTATTYTVYGTNGFGCVSSNTITVPVYTNSLTVSANTTICEGGSANLSAMGAVNYTWSSGSQFASTQVFPSNTNVYMVVGIDINGCNLTNSVTVTVDPQPQVSVMADKSLLCLGEAVNLNASGAATYSWSSNGGSNASLALTPQIDVAYSYTVTGTNNSGCSNIAVTTFTVNKCTGLNEQENSMFRSYPNPTQGLFTIEFEVPALRTVEVSDVTGRTILSTTNSERNLQVNLDGYAAGIYYIHVRAGENSQTHKIVKQ